jgi:hypothetical protein
MHNIWTHAWLFLNPAVSEAALTGTPRKHGPLHRLRLCENRTMHQRLRVLSLFQPTRLQQREHRIRHNVGSVIGSHKRRCKPHQRCLV